MNKKLRIFSVSRDCFEHTSPLLEADSIEYKIIDENTYPGFDYKYQHMDDRFRAVDIGYGDEPIFVECVLEPNVFWDYCVKSGWTEVIPY